MKLTINVSSDSNQLPRFMDNYVQFFNILFCDQLFSLPFTMQIF